MTIVKGEPDQRASNERTEDEAIRSWTVWHRWSSAPRIIRPLRSEHGN